MIAVNQWANSSNLTSWVMATIFAMFYHKNNITFDWCKLATCTCGTYQYHSKIVENGVYPQLMNQSTWWLRLFVSQSWRSHPSVRLSVLMVKSLRLFVCQYWWLSSSVCLKVSPDGQVRPSVCKSVLMVKSVLLCVSQYWWLSPYVCL